jgi:hypothetical protein
LSFVDIREVAAEFGLTPTVQHVEIANAFGSLLLHTKYTDERELRERGHWVFFETAELRLQQLELFHYEAFSMLYNKSTLSLRSPTEARLILMPIVSPC